MRKFFLVLPLFLLLLCCHGKKATTTRTLPPSNLNEPDRVLFERAMKDMEKSRFTVARLTLQTLISTYPDSEFLPQAKYAMAESFYRESTSSTLTEAENGFKDYITFFPASELADDAQMKIAMTHVKRLEKADRDTTQGQLAEIEFKSFIESYPDSPLINEAKEKLREVQELLADGIFGVGNFYLVSRKDYRAAISRYQEVLKKYPDYSRTPDTLFSLGFSLQQLGAGKDAAIYYARIVTDHPLSDRVVQAKQQLTAMNEPIPEPNPVALARAQQNQREVPPGGVLGKLYAILKPSPGVSTNTAAASNAAAEEATSDTNSGPVRGGTTGGGNAAKAGGANDSPAFSVTPAVASPQPGRSVTVSAGSSSTSPSVASPEQPPAKK
ncbi:MAG TPA: outer membrane protein assembly factor BamD [Terriglobia bacterium]|jgi:outer membrane protein assembly factor BamD